VGGLGGGFLFVGCGGGVGLVGGGVGLLGVGVLGCGVWGGVGCFLHRGGRGGEVWLFGEEGVGCGEGWGGRGAGSIFCFGFVVCCFVVLWLPQWPRGRVPAGPAQIKCRRDICGVERGVSEPSVSWKGRVQIQGGKGSRQSRLGEVGGP